MLDLNLNQFDILPDGLGFLIIASGCSGLAVHSPRFNVARQLCFVLLVLWVIGFASLGDMDVLLMLVGTAFNFAMFWNLLGGIAEYSQDRGRLDFAGRAETWRMLYIMLMGIITFVALTMRGWGVDPSLAVILFVAVIYVMVMILKLIHDVKTHLAMRRPAMNSFEVQ